MDLVSRISPSLMAIHEIQNCENWSGNEAHIPVREIKNRNKKKFIKPTFACFRETKYPQNIRCIRYYCTNMYVGTQQGGQYREVAALDLEETFWFPLLNEIFYVLHKVSQNTDDVWYIVTQCLRLRTNLFPNSSPFSPSLPT